MTHFILVHGSCNGAWCWYKLVPLLESNGHRVTPVDLAACGNNTKQLCEINSLADYAQPLMDVLASVAPEEKVVLVGHGFGGLCLDLAVKNFPTISVAVYVTALMGIQLSHIQEEFHKSVQGFKHIRFVYDDGPENPPTSITLSLEYMMKMMYQLSPPEDFIMATKWARPTRFFKDETNMDAMITDENYEPVDRVYIICKEDQANKEDFQRWMIEQSPVKEVKEIEGADHAAMFSKPMELCNCLLEIAQKYN